MSRLGGKRRYAETNGGRLKALADRIWRWLRSPRLALVLLLMLVPATILGTLVPQEPRFSPQEFARWRSAHAAFTALAEPLSLHNLYSSWWFLGMLGLLTVNTLACTIHHVQRELPFWGRRGFTPPVGLLEQVEFFDNQEGSEALEALPGRVLPVFRRLKYRHSLRREPERVSIWARKGYLGGWGSIIFHSGLVVVFAGGFFSGATRFSGYTELVEGQSMVEKWGAYQQVSHGPFFWTGHKGFWVRLEEHRSLTSRIGIWDRSGEVLERTIRVNEPTSYRGVSIYQGEYNGPAPLFALSMKGRNTAGYVNFVPRRGEPNGARQVFRLPGTPYEVEALLDWAERAMDITVRHGPRVVFSGPLTLGGSINLPVGALEFSGLKRWTSLRFVQDHGAPVVFAGFVVSLAGVFMLLFSDRWQIWVVFSSRPGETELHMGGHARKSKAFFDEELEEAKAEVVRALEQEAPSLALQEA